jgi:hypothetical protein
MSASIINNAAFLRTSRDFPEDLHMGFRETNKAYIEIAEKVNERIIGLFTTTRSTITGEAWFLLNNQRQQSFRQVYMLTVTAGVFNSINHGIKVVTPFQFNPKCYGSYTDGTNSYGLIFGSNSATSIPGQISFYITATQIIFIADAAAPTPTAGMVLLEWISQV